MKKMFILFVLLSLTFAANSQFTKGYWLLGGTGSLYSTTNDFENVLLTQHSKEVTIKLSPNIGYFLFDKFALGVRPSFTKHKEDVVAGGYTNINRFEIGPFARFYFLPVGKQFNLLTEVCAQWGSYSFSPTKGHNNTLSASAGPVIFLNTSVGLEMLVGYYSRNEVVTEQYETKQSGLQVLIGFQIHLEKN